MRVPADADPQFEPAARQEMQAGDVLGDEHRVAQCRDENAGRELERARAPGRKAKRFEWRQPCGAVEAARRQDMLDRPRGFEAARFGLTREFTQPRCFRKIEIVKRKTRQDKPEAHRAILRNHLQLHPPASQESRMSDFTYDHVHLRSPDPDATAAYYERMFGAKIIKSVMSNGLPRTDMELGGVMVFIAQVPADAALSEKPDGSYVGLDHLGMRVSTIDQVC